MSALVFIYELYESDTGIVRYVGRTENPKRRLCQHKSSPQKCNVGWMAAAKARGAEPLMRIVYSVRPQDSVAAEYSHRDAMIRAAHPIVGENPPPKGGFAARKAVVSAKKHADFLLMAKVVMKKMPKILPSRLSRP